MRKAPGVWNAFLNLVVRANASRELHIIPHGACTQAGNLR